MNEKRTFVITGASQGIGFATAVRLNKEGFNVIGIARHKPESFPGDFYIADLTDEAASQKVFETINGSHKIDGLINNVGTGAIAPLGKINPEDLHSVLDINMRPALQAAQIFLPGMVGRKYGRIINVAARSALGMPYLSAYSAAKAGLVALTRSWAIELATTGITVNAVAPGPIGTESLLKWAPKGSDNEKMTLQKIPLGRLGKPEEVAATIAFLASDDAGFITGQTVFIDGGASVK